MQITRIIYEWKRSNTKQKQTQKQKQKQTQTQNQGRIAVGCGWLIDHSLIDQLLANIGYDSESIQRFTVSQIGKKEYELSITPFSITIKEAKLLSQSKMNLMRIHGERKPKTKQKQINSGQILDLLIRNKASSNQTKMCYDIPDEDQSLTNEQTKFKIMQHIADCPNIDIPGCCG